MKQADFTRTEEIGEFDGIEIHIEAKIKTAFDGTGQPLYTVSMELYGWWGKRVIDLFPVIYYLCPKLYKSLENEALEKAE